MTESDNCKTTAEAHATTDEQPQQALETVALLAVPAFLDRTHHRGYFRVTFRYFQQID